MARKNVLFVGAGRRVLEAALPAAQLLHEHYVVRGVVARKRRTVQAGDASYETRPLPELSPDDLASVDLVYLAVAKPAVPSVLERLTRFDLSRVDLLIDTPVLLYKHFAHVPRLAAFRSVWVAEDCAELPWIDAVRAAVTAGTLAEPRTVELHHSAWKYHGLALSKALLGAERVAAATRRRTGRGPDEALRRVRFDGGGSARIHEPREYARGWLVVRGAGLSCASDDPERAGGGLRLAPIVEGGAWRGFRVGDVEARLDPLETRALEEGGPVPLDRGIVARTDDLKRVGLLRMLRRIAAGGAGYPLEQALDDTLADYWLDKLGWYRPGTPLDPRTAAGRAVLGGLTRLSRLARG